MITAPPTPPPDREKQVRKVYLDANLFARQAVAAGYEADAVAEALLHSALDISSPYDFSKIFERFRTKRGAALRQRTAHEPRSRRRKRPSRQCPRHGRSPRAGPARSQLRSSRRRRRHSSCVPRYSGGRSGIFVRPSSLSMSAETRTMIASAKPSIRRRSTRSTRACRNGWTW